MTEPEQRLIDIAVLMAQELQEIIEYAIEASGDPDSMEATQELLKDWEEAYAAAGVKSWQQALAEAGDASELVGMGDVPD